MTIQELYDYAKDNNLLDKYINVRDYDGSFHDCEIIDLEVDGWDINFY